MDKATNQQEVKQKVYQPQEIITKTTETVEETQQETTITTNQKQPSYIRKKLIFNKFVKLVKKGGYTSARLIAKSLGVHKDTILEWSNTSKVKEALGTDIATYVLNIKRNKDWKASAYLLDKVLDQDKGTEQTINLTNLIQVNTIESNKNNKGDTTL